MIDPVAVAAVTSLVVWAVAGAAWKRIEHERATERDHWRQLRAVSLADVTWTALGSRPFSDHEWSGMLVTVPASTPAGVRMPAKSRGVARGDSRPRPAARSLRVDTRVGLGGPPRPLDDTEGATA